jgi:hypothetical protein
MFYHSIVVLYVIYGQVLYPLVPCGAFCGLTEYENKYQYHLDIPTTK